MTSFTGSFSGLLVLRIRLEIAEEGEVVCSLQGREWRFSTRELGLPEHFDRRFERSGGYSFRFPDWAIDEMRADLAGGAPGEPLWLHLERPSGYLGAVPWERLLQPALGIPVLRLPVVEAGLPRETPRTLEVLLCASGPVAKESIDVAPTLRMMVDQMRSQAFRRIRIHVFTDQEFQGALPLEWTRGGALAGGEVIVHDPQGAARFAIPEAHERVSEVKDRLESPWLLWMRQALSGRSVDVAHFLCHGYLSFDRGALSLAESPLENQDRRSARFVGVHELNTFLTQVGAWSTAFSSPENNYSEVGLRLLADSVAQTRPGPLLIHDLPRDPGCPALGAAYRFLYAPFPEIPPASSALAIQCQPSRVARVVAAMRGGLESFSAGTEAPLPPPGSPAASAEADPLAQVFSTTENVPTWVAAATRYVEQQAVRLQENEEAAPTESRRSDQATDTLRQIQDIIAEIASRGSGGGS